MSFLLFKNGEATKARCCQCAKLYVPKDAEIEASKRKGYGFMCSVCRDAVTERFRPLNRRRAI